MREVAKSMLGFSWAVSLFGVQQITKAMAPSATQPHDTTVAEVEEVSRAVQSHLFGNAALQFRAGDEWQRRVVDAFFDAASMQSLDPRKMVEAMDPRALLQTADPRRMVQSGMEVMQQSVDAAVDVVKETADRAVEVAKQAVASVRPSSTTT